MNYIKKNGGRRPGSGRHKLPPELRRERVCVWVTKEVLSAFEDYSDVTEFAKKEIINESNRRKSLGAGLSESSDTDKL